MSLFTQNKGEVRKEEAPPNRAISAAKSHARIRELVIFALLGAIMFGSKVIMEGLPNIHPLGMLIMVYTLVFRVNALIPLYLYVFLNGLFAGFSPWWLPYLYIWTILWGVTMLLPRRIPDKVAAFAYPVICALHGLFFGVLYAPVQAILYGMNFEETLVWIAAGFSFDLLHFFGDFALGLLILPLSKLLKRLASK